MRASDYPHGQYRHLNNKIQENIFILLSFLYIFKCNTRIILIPQHHSLAQPPAYPSSSPCTELIPARVYADTG